MLERSFGLSYSDSRPNGISSLVNDFFTAQIQIFSTLMTMETVAAGEPRTTGHPCGRSLRARRRNGRTSVALADWNEKVARSAAMELVAQGHKALAIHRAAQALYDVGGVNMPRRVPRTGCQNIPPVNCRRD
jgi:hypothetical protein